MKKKLHSKYVSGICVILLFFLAINCDGTINPITPKGFEYSMYGPLNIHKTPNFIRVYDTNTLLNPEATKELNVNMTFTNLATGEVNLLKDSLVTFDDIYTHNYEIEMPIEYDTRYKLFLEDENGFRDSVITQTTKQTNITVSIDTVDHCDQFFYVELSNIDLDAGERLDHEVGIEIADTWYWTHRKAYYSYSSESNILTLGWSPNSVLCLINKCLDPFQKFQDACRNYSSNKIRFRFTHIGYMIGEETLEDIDLDSLGGSPHNQQIVLSKYGWEIEATTIADEVFIYGF